MSKVLSYEEKLELIRLWKEENYSIKMLSDHFGVAKSVVERWRKRYLIHGEKGLILQTTNPPYSEEQKYASIIRIRKLNLRLHKYDEEAEESKYLIKTEERIRSDIIKYFIEQNIEHFSEIEDLSEQITDPKCIYLGRFKKGNRYYIEIIEEQAFSQADEKAPIFTVRVRKPNNQ